MRPLRYSINVTLDGCCDHRAIPADEDLHRHAAENLAQADALLFGRATHEMTEAAWARAAHRPPGGPLPPPAARPPRRGRCPSFWRGDLGKEGGSVAAAGANGSEA